MTTVGIGPAPSRLWRWLVCSRLSLFLVTLALALQAVGHINCDVSWLITFSEKYLGGAIPYVDVTDPNPPFAFVSLLPPILAARALAVPVEPAIVAYVFLVAGASIHLCGAVLDHGPARAPGEKRILLNAAVFLFLVAPGFAFAQREQLALMLMAPMFMLMTITDESAPPPLSLRVLIGALAGLAVGFKPFYVVPLGLPMVATCWRRRSIAGLFDPEKLAAAGGAIAQLLCILVFFPAYLHDQLPGVAQTYMRIRLPWTDLLLCGPTALTIALLTGLPLAVKWGAAPATDWRLPTASRVCALAAGGFVVTFLLQGKGWINHAYPGLVLALFAWIFAILDAHAQISEERRGWLFRFFLAPSLAIAPVLFLVHAPLLGLEEFPGLREAVMRVAPSRPRIMALADQLVVGHPLSRQVEAEWVGRASALWMSHAAELLLPKEKDPTVRDRLEAFIRRDFAGFAEDVRLRRPVVILVDGKATREIAEARPETHGVLSRYRLADRVGEIEIWRRAGE